MPSLLFIDTVAWGFIHFPRGVGRFSHAEKIVHRIAFMVCRRCLACDWIACTMYCTLFNGVSFLAEEWKKERKAKTTEQMNIISHYRKHNDLQLRCYSFSFATNVRKWNFAPQQNLKEMETHLCWCYFGFSFALCVRCTPNHCCLNKNKLLWRLYIYEETPFVCMRWVKRWDWIEKRWKFKENYAYVLLVCADYKLYWFCMLNTFSLLQLSHSHVL